MLNFNSKHFLSGQEGHNVQAAGHAVIPPSHGLICGYMHGSTMHAQAWTGQGGTKAYSCSMHAYTDDLIGNC